MWQIDPRLDADSELIIETGTLEWRLFNDHRYDWIIIIPKVADVTELFQLSNAQQSELIRSGNETAQLLLKHCGVDKVNCGYLGNVVSQLHYHVVGRKTSDEAWPGPVWGHSPRAPYSTDALEEKLDEWRNLLA